MDSLDHRLVKKSCIERLKTRKRTGEAILLSSR